MKMTLPTILFAAFIFAGCGDKPSQTAPANNSASDNPLNAPSGYVGALCRGQTLAVKTVDVVSLNEAVQMFYAQESRFPKDLNELLQSKLIDKIPDPPRGMKLEYDATAGKVSVVDAQ